MSGDVDDSTKVPGSGQGGFPSNPYEIDGVDTGETSVTKSSAPELIEGFFWVQLASHGAGKSHFPGIADDNLAVKPLCHSRNNDDSGWKKKNPSELPAVWVDLCDKCEALANGHDYMKSRGKTMVG